MDPITLLLIAAVLIVVDVLAVAFGFDSRDGFGDSFGDDHRRASPVDRTRDWVAMRRVDDND
jgi:hypothetical protein